MRRQHPIDETSHLITSDTEQLAMPPPSVLLFLAYCAWLIMTPYESPWLGFLTDIRFERILAALLVVSSILFGRLENIFRLAPIGALTLFVWMVISHSNTDFPDYPAVTMWRDEYWKLIVFFLGAASCFRNLKEVRVALFGIMLIIATYQVLSWIDFLRGGSYVYQQGLKRMVGLWSGGGLGSANGWGFLGVVALPISAVTTLTAQGKTKWLGAICSILSLLSVVFSGTRGAMLVACLYLAIIGWKQVFRIKNLLAVLIASVVLFPLLPEAIQQRYLSVFVRTEKEKIGKVDEIAIKSQEERIQGLIDGFRIAAEYPLLGCGPGASPIARSRLNGNLFVDSGDEKLLQLHNLYGQLVSELGFFGMALWFLIISYCCLGLFRHLRALVPANLNHMAFNKEIAVGRILLGQLIVMLAYGMVSHTLYDFKWLIFFATCSGYFVFRTTRFQGSSTNQDVPFQNA